PKFIVSPLRYGLLRPNRCLFKSMHSVSSTGPIALWPDAVPPIPPREDLDIRQLGRHRVDPYAWMKFIPPSGARTLDSLPERLRKHLDAEMKYAQDILRPLANEAEHYYKRMSQRACGFSDPLPVSSKGWRYDSALPAGHAHRVFS